MRNKECNSCGMFFNCRNVCLMPDEPQQADLMVILEYPSEQDDITGKVVGSKRDYLIKNILENAIGADMDKIYFTYLVKCKPVKGEKPTDTDIAACMQYLKKEIKAVKPKAILAIGETVMKVLTGQKGIIANAGRVFTKEFKSKEGVLTVTVVPALSPFYVEQNKSGLLLQSFAQDINKAYTLSQGKALSVSKTKIKECGSVEDVRKLASHVRKTGVMCFDFETTKIGKRGIYDPEFKVTLLSVSFQIGSSWTIPLNHFETPFKQIELMEIIEIIGELWADVNIRKVAHNFKFDKQVAILFGKLLGVIIVFRGRQDDTMLMHHLYDEDAKHGLKDITDNWFPDFSGYEKEVKRYSWDKVPLATLAPYAGTDTDLTLRLCTILENYLLEDERVYTIYRSLQMAALKPLCDAEIHGMYIDEDGLSKNLSEATYLMKKQEDKLRENKKVRRFEEHMATLSREANIQKLEEKIPTLKGKRLLDAQKTLNEVRTGILKTYEGVNFESNPQLQKLFYDKEGFGHKKLWDRKKKDETAGTGKEVLMELPDRDGFIQDFLLYRTLTKTVSTYMIGLSDRLDMEGMVHTSFLQHGTESGRLSSRNPNLQNLTNVTKLKDPIAIKVVSMVKKPFVVPKGWTFVQVDYSQAELRIVASFANEKVMLDAYNRGEDLHALTASTMLDITLEAFYKLDAKEQKAWRNKAKPVNFGLIYGMSAEGLVDYAKNNYGVIMTLEEATTWRNKYFKKYPALLVYHATYTAKAQKFGYVRTLFGRKRHTPDILGPVSFIRGEEERVAINSPVQGTAGEFTIFAEALLHNRVDSSVVKFVNTIHDSLLFYIRTDVLDKNLRIIKHTCENLPIEQYFGRALDNVTMKVDIETSVTCWTDTAPYELAA